MHAALAFVLDLNRTLALAEWSEDVLALPHCAEVLVAGGHRLYAGPRIRSALHLATSGTFVAKVHDISKHLSLEGASTKYTRNLCDCASGGQVLVSAAAAAWLTEHPPVDTAGVLERIGCLCTPCPTAGGATSTYDALYQAHPRWGSTMPRRAFPIPVDSHGMVFIPTSISTHSLSVRPIEMVEKMAEKSEDLTHLVVQLCDGASPCDEVVGLVLSIVQVYGGALVSENNDKSRLAEQMLLVFPSPHKAASSACALQLVMQLDSWLDLSSESRHKRAGRQIKPLKDGHSIAYSMVVHVANEADSGEEVGGGARGTVASTAKRLATLARKGQILVTDEAWKAMLGHAPRDANVINIGRHLLWEKPKQKHMTLFQIASTHGRKIQNDPPATLCTIEAGYFDSPDPGKGVAIVFAQAILPDDVSECDLVRQALHQWSGLCRITVQRHNGYLCKEPEPGKFTIAFEEIGAAMSFGACAQSALMGAAFPLGEGLGFLKARIGMAWGDDVIRKPLGATGRADYFGLTANMAARVMGQAQPSQVLCELTRPPRGENKISEAWKSIFLGDGTANPTVPMRDGNRVRMSSVGAVRLKGVDGERICVMIELSSDPHVEFDAPKSWSSDGLELAKGMSSRRSVTFGERWNSEMSYIRSSNAV